MSKKRAIIIDALNMYFRSYTSNPSISLQGLPIGGTKGFLTSLQKLCRDLKPDKVVIVWDGPGGSRRRKSKNKSYKEGRSPIRLNRNVRSLTDEEEMQNKVWQQARLIEYLNLLPVSQIMVDGVEADDVIAYACQILPDYNKIIVSNDKDFIQLCNHDTILFRPTQGETLNKNRVIEQYGISPNWFALARAIAGDKSDNLPGVPGIGLKTIAKRFPFFNDPHKASCFYKLYEHCRENIDGVKVYGNILENRKLIESNHNLMQLYAPSFSPSSKRYIRESVHDLRAEFNKTGIEKMMNEDGFDYMNWSDLKAHMNKIVADN